MKAAITQLCTDARQIRVGDTVNTFTHHRPCLATVVRVMATTWHDMRGTKVPAIEFLVRDLATGELDTVTRVCGAQIWRVVA